MTAGKHCCCCGLTQSAWGRISNTFPSKEPAMKPPMCMKLSIRGNSPYITEVRKKTAVEMIDRMRWCGELASQFMNASASLAPTKPMAAPVAPTETRPCMNSTEARAPANPAREISKWPSHREDTLCDFGVKENECAYLEKSEFSLQLDTDVE